ncbi:hypothetical protein RMCBS344292_06752 [Rhizopus microsporus]|nr:hypothetical protein RMCBS344292_06752 [Rhizopus microsporus]
MNNNNNSNFGDLLASHSTNNNHHNKLTTLNIGSLNCRDLRKTANPATSAAFICYLRTVSLDILALRETHANTDKIAQLFKTQFQANISYWSNYCGIVCFSPFLSLSEPIWNTIQHTLTVKISHIHEAFDPVFVTVVYVPADTAHRLSYLQSSLLNPHGIFNTAPARYILLGGFNYSYTVNISPHSYLDAPIEWLEYVAGHIDSIIATGQTHQPTFHRGNSSSCIDYIFVSRDLAQTCLAPTSRYIQPCWSDHMLLSLPLHLAPTSRLSGDGQSPPSLGKGIWRAYPRLATSCSFRDQLYKAVSAGVSSFPYSMSVQCQWDAIKDIAKREAQRYSRHQTFSLTTAEKVLQHKRSAIAKRILDIPTSSPQLSS